MRVSGTNSPLPAEDESWGIEYFDPLADSIAHSIAFEAVQRTTAPVDHTMDLLFSKVAATLSDQWASQEDREAAEQALGIIEDLVAWSIPMLVLRTCEAVLLHLPTLGLDHSLEEMLQESMRLVGYDDTEKVNTLIAECIGPMRSRLAEALPDLTFDPLRIENTLAAGNVAVGEWSDKQRKDAA